MGSTEAAEETLKWQIYDLSFSVHKSRRYHEKLYGFYGAWRDSMKYVTVIAGSGVFFLLFAGTVAEAIAQTISAMIALWSVMDIVVSPDKKAEIHKDLCERFTLMAAELETMARTAEEYARMAAAKLRLENDEPKPCKRLVDLLARNDECRARGLPPEDLVPLSKAQRYFGYFFTFDMERLEQWKAERQASSAG